MENEIYQGLIGKQVGRYWYGVGHWDAEGHPCQVNFNPYNVMERELKNHDVVGFFHTHPQFSSRPSDLDRRTMEAWAIAFGKPLACCIRGVDGLKVHWYIDDETPHITCWVKQFGRLFVGRIPKAVRGNF